MNYDIQYVVNPLGDRRRKISLQEGQMCPLKEAASTPGWQSESIKMIECKFASTSDNFCDLVGLFDCNEVAIWITDECLREIFGDGFSKTVDI